MRRRCKCAKNKPRGCPPGAATIRLSPQGVQPWGLNRIYLPWTALAADLVVGA